MKECHQSFFFKDNEPSTGGGGGGISVEVACQPVKEALTALVQKKGFSRD